MKTCIAMLCGALVVSSAMADPYSMAEQQARRVSSQNNAEQQRIANAAGGTPASAAPSSPSAPAAPPANPVLEATLANINSLQSDFAAIAGFSGGQPDSDQRISLLNHLSAAAEGAKASSESVKSLADDLLTAVSGKKTLTTAQQRQLAGFVHAIFNSSHLTAAQQGQVFDGVQKTLAAAGVDTDAASDVVTDLKKIADETK